MIPSSGTSDAVTAELRCVVEELATLHGCHTAISVEGDYRRASLLAELLPIYVQIWGRWYLDPGEGLRRIAAEDPRARDAFAAALTPGAPDAALARLVEIVLEDAAAGGD